MYSHTSKGFTIIELIISLLVGLIIVAATTSLFLSSQKSYVVQQASAEIQDNTNFGLNYIVKNLRRVSSNGGIVFAGNTGTSWAITGSNTNTASDQLTIQYMPTVEEFPKGGKLFNCMGEEITSGQTVTERYFLRRNGGLACQASNVGGDLSGNGQLIMPTADYFRALLVVRDTNGNLRSMSAQPSATDQIVGFQLGILVRSNQSVGADTFVNDNDSIVILDKKDIQLLDSVKTSSQRYLRQVVIQAVALRNGVGN